MQCFDDLLGLLSELRNLIESPNTDVTWSHYDNVEDVITALDTFKQKLELGEHQVISELKLIFAPTGSFQEISIDSGWGERFIELGTRFDDIVNRK